MSTVRNIFRRRLRAFLTIFGITIGVFALVVMGSMAEKINLLIDGGTRYYSDKVIISDASTSMGAISTTPISVGRIPEIENVPGVARASASVYMLLKKDQGMSMGVPQGIMGTDMRQVGYEKFKLTMAAGRDLAPSDRGKAVVGSDVAKALNAQVGKRIELRGEMFEVVGIYNKTLTAPDNTVTISMADVQALLYAQLPSIIQQQVKPEQLATGITAYPQSGVDPNQLATTIQGTVSGVNANGPKAFTDQFKSATKIFNSIIFGVALISLLVGGLSVVNTMTMSVFERTREIGIRKAIGASHRQIVGQFLIESAMIGFLGGVTGLALGWITSIAVNAVMASSGTVLFLVTPRLALGSLAFAIVLGVGSGFYPSLHAARLKPVLALRYE
ncbi:MAG: ABC transporter permease [Actinobacteria bacterium]|nr:ABC transporter permease [Actinomycetota bacterium]